MNSYKGLFPRAAELAYLDSAAEGLPLPVGEEALHQYFALKSKGTPGRTGLYEEERAARQALARLLNGREQDVALLSSAGDALNIFANSLEWRDGDEVVISDLEFPSGVVSWLRLEHRGVKLRVIPTRQGGAITLDDFSGVIGPATRIVCVSHVSYKTGTRIPFLADLGRLAHRHGALLIVDATQSLGRVPVCLDEVDFLVASGYKWLLGVHGMGVAWLSPAAAARCRLTPGALGWYSLDNVFSPDRFTRYQAKSGAGWMMCGMPVFPSIFALRRSVEFLLEAGVENIEMALRPVVQTLRSGLAELGLDLLTPPGPEYASGIVSFAHPEFERIGAALERAGVIVWSGDGRVRASVHLYNDAGDVDRLLDVLAGLTREDAPCTNRRS
jgi:cysteine desulfurase / selenocysteine lyase